MATKPQHTDLAEQLAAAHALALKPVSEGYCARFDDAYAKIGTVFDVFRIRAEIKARAVPAKAREAA